jgi:hypothetical protein
MMAIAASEAAVQTKRHKRRICKLRANYLKHKQFAASARYASFWTCGAGRIT